MCGQTHRPSLKSFVIAASIQREIDAQAGNPPKRIPIIVCLKDSKEHPESGCRPPRTTSKNICAARPSR